MAPKGERIAPWEFELEPTSSGEPASGEALQAEAIEKSDRVYRRPARAGLLCGEEAPRRKHGGIRDPVLPRRPPGYRSPPVREHWGIHPGRALRGQALLYPPPSRDDAGASPAPSGALRRLDGETRALVPLRRLYWSVDP